jgi:hypothetical protein
MQAEPALAAPQELASPPPAARAEEPASTSAEWLAEPAERDEPTGRPPPPPSGATTDVDLHAESGAQESEPNDLGAPAAEEVVSEKAQSQERLVAAEAVASDALSEAEAPTGLRATVEAAPSAPEVEAVVVEDASLDDDGMEEAPVSSQRAVAPAPEERLEQLAFGVDDEARPPLHTPPPESGSLLAAAPLDFDMDVTAVRDAPSLPSHGSELGDEEPAAAEASAVEVRGARESVPAPVPVPVPEPVPSPARELVPEAIVARVPAGDAVADLIGEAARFSPTTFVALLDASLTL